MNRRITMTAVAFAAVFFTLPAYAVTLGDIAAAMSAPANTPQATGDWSALSKLKGSKWKGAAPAKGGNTYYWNGTVPIDGWGLGQVSLSGTQTQVLTAGVGMPKDIQLAKVPQILAAQFPRDAKLEQVRGACPDERLGGSRIYRATLAGRKPLFLHIQFAPGDRGGSISTIEMEPQRNKGWIC